MIFYKEAEFQSSPIGMIPKDWEVTNISDASLLVTDGSHFSPKHQSSGYPLATVANMRENDIDVDSCYRITKEDYEKLVATGDKPEVNDILFSKDGTVGQCIVFRQKVDLIILSSIAIIRPNLKKANPYFLKYMLQSPAALGRIIGSKTGSAIKRIILRDLNSIKIALPKKLEEQKRIVEVLTVVDSAIEVIDKIIAKTERLKKGLMQQLLTRGIGHAEYKNTQIGKIPETWQVEKLENVAEIRSNKSIKNHEQIAFIPMELVPDSRIYSKYEMRRKEDVKSSTYCKAGDLLLAKITPSLENGKQGIVPSDVPNGIALATTEVFPIHCKKIGNLFLFYVLKVSNFRNKIISSMTGSTGRQRASKESVERLEIPVPPPDEQQRITNIFYTVDKKLELERDEKTKLEKIKHGLMDLLLTGKVRVKVD